MIFSALTSIFSNKKKKKASRRAEQIFADTSRENNALFRETRDLNTALVTPTLNRGNAAGDAYNALLLGDGAAYRPAYDQYRNSTGYDFRVSEGNRALNSGWAHKGALRSGAAGKAFQQFGQNIGSQEFGNYMGMLDNQQRIGLGATNALMGVNSDYSGNVTGQNNILANVRANGALSRGALSAQPWDLLGSGLDRGAGFAMSMLGGGSSFGG